MDTNTTILDQPYQPISCLTPEQVRHFEADGFIALPQIAPVKDVQAIRRTIIRMHEKKTGFREGAQFDLLGADDRAVPRITQILSPHLFAKSLRRSVFFKNAFTVAKQLLGPDTQFSFDHALIKPAHTGAATPWHQDEAFRDPAFDYHELSVWMPLQPVNLENGCMEFIPGSQLQDILPHRSPSGDVSVHALECAVPVDQREVIACPLPAGGCTIHMPRTLHGTGPNRSAAPRYAYVLGFNTPRQHCAVPRDFPWRVEKQEVRSAREENWRRRGGGLILKWRDLQRRHPRWLLDDYI